LQSSNYTILIVKYISGMKRKRDRNLTIMECTMFVCLFVCLFVFFVTDNVRYRHIEKFQATKN
jgi:hypothetical protein